jgi:hypothetical protein
VPRSRSLDAWSAVRVPCSGAIPSLRAISPPMDSERFTDNGDSHVIVWIDEVSRRSRRSAVDESGSATEVEQHREERDPQDDADRPFQANGVTKERAALRSRGGSKGRQGFQGRAPHRVTWGVIRGLYLRAGRGLHPSPPQEGSARGD